MYNSNPVFTFLLSDSIILTYLFLFFAVSRAVQIQHRYPRLTIGFVVNCLCWFVWWPIELVKLVRLTVMPVYYYGVDMGISKGRSAAVTVSVDDSGQMSLVSPLLTDHQNDLKAKALVMYEAQLNTIEDILASRGVNCFDSDFDPIPHLALEQLLTGYELALEEKERALTSVCDILQDCSDPHVKAAFVFADQAKRKSHLV